MVFMDRSDASTLQQHAQTVLQSVGQVLLLFGELIDTPPSLDHECAEATEALLRSQGQVTPLEHGRAASRLAVGNYELQADLNDRSGRPTFTVYDLETGETVMRARRTAQGDYELQTVNYPLSHEQKHAFLSQLHQTLQGEVVPGMTGLERLQAMTRAMDEQAPRGCKAMLVADALLGDQLETADQQYTYRRGADGGLSITETKTQSLVAVMSPTGTIDQALSQKDQAYFKQAFERLRLAERYRAAAAGLEADAAIALDPDTTPVSEPQALVVSPATPVSVVEVLDAEFVEPPGQRRIQSRVSQLGLASAGGDLALYVGAQLVVQHGGQEYVGERYRVTAYDNGAMTIHATGNPVPLVYANSAGQVTSQLTPEQSSQFWQMYQSLTQPQVTAPALTTGRTGTPRALQSARSVDMGGR